MLVVLALLCAGLDNAAQQPAAVEAQTKDASLPPTFTSRVNLVPVTVVVRHNNGRAVGTLKKEDFRIFDEGKQQIITQFAVETKEHAAPARQPSDSATRDSNSSTSVLASQFIAYVFDDLHLRFSDMAYVRDAALSVLSGPVSPEKRIAIYTTSGQNTVEFTGDVEEIQAALRRLRPMPQTGSTGTKCPDIGYYLADLIVNRDDEEALAVATAEYKSCSNNSFVSSRETEMMARAELSEGERDSRLAVSVLTGVVRRLSGMPGQRSIVFASPGFFIGAFEHRDVAELINRAIRAKVMVDGINSRGLWTPPAYDASVRAPEGGPAVISKVAMYRQSEVMAESETLGEISEGTGGTYVHDNNDLTGAIRRLATTPEAYYVLGFTPENLRSDGKFHKLNVTLRQRNGLSVQARNGYFAPQKGTDVTDQARQDVEDAVFSRAVLEEIGFDVQTQFFKVNDEQARLSVITQLDLKTLKYRKADGRNRDDVTVVTALFDTSGNFIGGTRKVIELQLKDETVAKLDTPLSPTFSARTTFEVKPGPYAIRVVVRDSEGKMLAAKNAAIEIP
jgi:VWFA-related protein